MPKLPRFLDRSNPLEKKIEAKACAYAKNAYGIESRKYATPAHRASPDRIFFIGAGFVFFIEFKSRDGVCTPAQLIEHNWYRHMGYMVFVCNSYQSAVECIDKIAKENFLLHV